tara:strand:- start:974 stop:1408 length:435 start_codon:yes stop_codon:yes gene_type:complete
MTLYDKILKIQYDNQLNATDFINVSGLSRGVYYAIKDGTKTELKPNQARLLCDKFGILESEWFSDESKKEQNNTIKYKQTKPASSINFSNLTDEVVESEFLKRFERLSNRPIIKMVIDSKIELELSKRLIKMSKTGELIKWLNT